MSSQLPQRLLQPTLGWQWPTCATLLTQSRNSSPLSLYRWQPSPLQRGVGVNPISGGAPCPCTQAPQGRAPDHVQRPLVVHVGLLVGRQRLPAPGHERGGVRVRLRLGRLQVQPSAAPSTAHRLLSSPAKPYLGLVAVAVAIRVLHGHPGPGTACTRAGLATQPDTLCNLAMPCTGPTRASSDLLLRQPARVWQAGRASVTAERALLCLLFAEPEILVRAWQS